VNLQDAAIGAGLASTVLVFLARFVFVTKGDLDEAIRRHEKSEAEALKERQGEERAWREKLDDKLDTLIRDLGDLRVEFAKVKYSRNQEQKKPLPADSDSHLPSVRRL
jgi:hypothetical protein